VATLRASRIAFAVLLLPATACHRFEKVNDLQAVIGTHGRITLSAEGRAGNARRLGGVATDVEGVFVQAPGDSIGMKADFVRFADLGVVQFAGGELHFTTKDVESLAQQRLNRRKTTIAAVIFGFGVVLLGAIVTVANTGGGSNGGGTVIPK
jgi:hypothetical protein